MFNTSKVVTGHWRERIEDFFPIQQNGDDELRGIQLNVRDGWSITITVRFEACAVRCVVEIKQG